MVIKKLVEPELNLYRSQCNFIGEEAEVFEMRSKGVGLEEIAERLEYSYDGIKKVSRTVDDKIRRVRNYFGTF